MGKKLVVNTAVCDMRNVQEETLAAYEQTVINAASVIISARAKELIAKYLVTLNCANTFETEGNVKLSTINGSAEINSSDAPEEDMYLVVNGSLQIGPNTDDVLKRYVGIMVNGSVLYPKGMSGKLGALTVNGSMDSYPDGAVILKRTAVIDRKFLLRMKPVLYWSARRMILVDPNLDGKALVDKGARFSTKTAVIAESLVEDVVGLFDENTDIEIVPDGTVVVRDDLTLDEVSARRYGGKLYILGNLTLTEEMRELLPKFEYLDVKGDVRLPASLVEAFTALESEYKELEVIRGKTISDKTVATVSRWMLERQPDGVLIIDCAMVKLDQDIPPELITEKLEIRDCASVKCTPEQEAAVTLIAKDVASIESGMELGDNLKKLLRGRDKDDTVVNAVQYVL